MAEQQLERRILAEAVKFGKNHRSNPLEQGNLFTILDMENKEVSAHSAFLYFVFKPFQTTDDEYDDFNLRCLLEILLKAKGEHKNINDYRCLDIRREVSFEFGRMDFVITADEETFAIELKIWAEEQPEQIPRYQSYLIEQGSDKDNIFFLTPSERESKTYKSVVNITLKKEIKEVLSSICERRREEKHERYATMIEQYISIIDKLTQGDSYMGETLDIIRNAEELKSIDYLIANRNRCLQKIMKEFFSELKKELGDKLSGEGIPDAQFRFYEYGDRSIEEYYYKNNPYPALAYEIEDGTFKVDCKLKENVKLYFFIEVKDNLYCGITPRIVSTQNNNELEWIRCNEAMENSQALIDSVKRIQKTGHTDTFAIWKHLTSDKKNINFTIGGLSSPESFLRLLTKDSLSLDKNKIKELANEIKHTYKEYCEAIFEKAL